MYLPKHAFHKCILHKHAFIKVFISVYLTKDALLRVHLLSTQSQECTC